ncbi:hypothetical protein CU048_07235 [Beijerinckiaceae bacterium]|nr:hypothetical protein CU048_07235 [Beijerinckiaceae bacterium]
MLYAAQNSSCNERCLLCWNRLPPFFNVFEITFQFFYRAIVSYKIDNTRNEVVIFVGEMRIITNDKRVPISQQDGSNTLSGIFAHHSHRAAKKFYPDSNVMS